MYFNKKRADKLMDQFDIDLLIASTPENVTYLSDTVSWAPKVYSYSVDMFATYYRDNNHNSSLIVPSQEMTYVSASNTWINDFYTYGGKSALIQESEQVIESAEENTYLNLQNNDDKRFPTAVEALIASIKNNTTKKLRIAIDEDKMTHKSTLKLQEELDNCELIPSSDLLRLIRMVKTDDEISAMKAAADLNETACTKVCNEIKIGMRELDIAEIYAQEVGKGLGKWLWFHFGSGRRSVGIFPPTEKKIQPGEMWKFDAGLSLNNYQADTGWGGVIGQPNAQQNMIWEATLRGYESAMSVIKEGVRPSEIQNAMLKGTQDGGLADHSGTFAGHAIGLEMRELPYVLGNKKMVNSLYLPEDTDIPLPENTVLCIENPCQIFGVGGTQIEQTIIVKKSGYELLTKQDRKLWIIE
ncbi:MAG: Xaa-Pro peptidase family protein [Pseudomonadota bacterium]|nr:Xaa-Pro peptidase family protein [Pseudomonadota bacterium]